MIRSTARRAPPVRILHLALGGTIACVEGPRGRVPRIAAKDLLSRVDLPNDVDVESVDFLRRTIVFPEDWTATASRIFRDRDRFDGFVLTLGTDTLAWVAAALELSLAGFPRPIVLTGSMEPFGAESSDARRNLEDAIRVASRGEAGVFVVFGGRIIEGTRASKSASEGPGAFESIGIDPIGTVSGKSVRWRRKPFRDGGGGEARCLARFETRVLTLTLEPQTSPADLQVDAETRGLLILGFGDGNVPNRLVPGFHRLLRRRLVVLASRCREGGVAHRYEGGRALIAAGACSAGELTNEAASVGISWALGLERRIDRAAARFQALAEASRTERTGLGT